MSDDTNRDNRFELAQQKAAQKGHAPSVGQSGSGPICEAPGCTNPGGAFTSERDGRIYQFCSEGCRARFESAPA
jgi:YHS domain-containing protein